MHKIGSGDLCEGLDTYFTTVEAFIAETMYNLLLRSIYVLMP